MKGLEKAMRKQYEYHRKSNEKKDKALRFVHNWAEEWIVKINGKLTLDDEKEIQKILEKLNLKM